MNSGILFSIENLVTKAGGPYSFDLQAGECLKIKGPSGSGKSMILRALSDLDEHQGRIVLDQREQSDYAPNLWRRKVIYCPSNSEWWHEKVGLHFINDQSHGIAALSLEHDLMDQAISKLSSGQKQRLALLRALQYQPQCLLLDEPSSHLDEDNTRLLEAYVMDYVQSKKACVIWVSHDERQRERLSGPEISLGDLHA